MEGSLSVVLEAQRLLSLVVEGSLHLLRLRLETRRPRQALDELEELFAVTAAHLVGLACKQGMMGRTN